MNAILQYSELLFAGALVTLIVWIISGLISFLIGALLGTISCRYLTTRTTKIFVRIYAFITKGVPAYVQILIAYFVLPALLGINISGFFAAIFALSICSSGYVTEIVRSGINTIDNGQWEASFVLGYSIRATLFRIILPQAFYNVLPALFGEFEQLLKSTSLLATIGVTELTRAGMNIISRELNPIPVYILIASIYLLFSAVLHVISGYIEKKVVYVGR